MDENVLIIIFFKIISVPIPDQDQIAVPDLVRQRPANQSKRRFSFKTVGESHAAKV